MKNWDWKIEIFWPVKPVSLVVHLTRDYPAAVPSKLTVSPFGNSFSDSEISELISELERISETKSKSKSPYLYDLCYSAQEILHQIKNKFIKPTSQSDDPTKTIAQENRFNFLIFKLLLFDFYSFLNRFSNWNLFCSCKHFVTI